MKRINLKTCYQSGMAILSMYFLLNIQHIQGEDDQAADAPSSEVTQEEVSDDPVANAGDNQAVASKALTTDELNAKFASEIADLKKVRDQFKILQGQINRLDPQLDDQIKKDHPEIFVYGADGFMSGKNMNAIIDLRMQDPQRVAWVKQVDDVLAQMNSIRDQINSEARAVGSTCQIGGLPEDQVFQLCD